MESESWIVQNLDKALGTWNEKLGEIWNLLTQTPEEFKGGTIWKVIVDIHGAVQAIALALLVLFFVVGVMKTCGSFAEFKRPELALKMFLRFVLAKAAVTYGLELMTALFIVVQGLISAIMNTAGFADSSSMVLPEEIVTAVESTGFFESIPLWGRYIAGQFVHYYSVLYSYSHCLRAVFQNLYLCRYRSRSFCRFCRRADAKYRQKLCKELRRRLSGRSSDCIGLCDLFSLCHFAAGGGYRCSGSDPGVDIHRRADL